MTPDEQAAWREAALEQVFIALASDRELSTRFVFKGAQVLARRLASSRRTSLDIDAMPTREATSVWLSGEDGARGLERQLRRALQRHFLRMHVIRYEIANLTVRAKPPGGHPRGWDAFAVRILLRDLERRSELGVPALTIDLSAPESLGERAVAPLRVGAKTVSAYTLARIAAEKLRGVLQSLPSYRRKVGRRPGAVRAKDLYDLAIILRARPITEALWKDVGAEFRVACRERAVDCAGVSSFVEAEGALRSQFERDETLPDDVTWSQAWSGLATIIARLERDGVLPFEFPDR